MSSLPPTSAEQIALFSLRELMLAIAVLALGIAGLFLESWAASAVLVFALLLSTVLAIHACVGCGRTRTFSIGFVVSATCYVTACLFYSACLGKDLDQSLIASSLIYPAYEKAVRREYTNSNTGQPLSPTDPNRNEQLPAGGYDMGVNGGSIFVTESPNRITFVQTFHVLIVMAFGYVFGKIAIFMEASNTEARNHERDEP